MNRRGYTAHDIAKMVGGQVVREGNVLASELVPIHQEVKGAISFLRDERFLTEVYRATPRMILTTRQISDKIRHGNHGIVVIENGTSEMYEALALIYDLVTSEDKSLIVPSISPNCEIHPSAVLNGSVHIDDHVVIEAAVSIGSGTRIGSHTKVKSGARIGPNVRVGQRCLIHENAVIGSEGFGFLKSDNGQRIRIPHFASVRIGDQVEIGASTVIDRGSVFDTIIGDGVKLDNLIQIAHGVRIGERTVIAAQSGVSGSTIIGRDCVIGGQVGIAGHLTIADGSQIQAKSGIASSILPEGQKWYGYPALKYLSYLRSYALFKRLPELLDRLERLEKRT
ncbi:MAG: UDP-3-O-(3-hydroxymyristoyl)glucosamine N-acyltransferase [Bacteroidota bacterium]